MSFDTRNLPPQSPYSPPQRHGGPTPTSDIPQGKKQSGFGIASFIMSILVGIGAFTIILVAGYMEASSPEGINEESPIAIIVGLCIFAVIGLNLLGIGLGVAGLCQPNRSRIFAILGLVFNGMVIMGIIGIMALGVAMGG
ncbi:putative membrane protein [Rhodopirellula maiorica SM1]|uniref:Putative membrane protein n=1 Tax=Rhodopirellula maiorica SM1 TaxID=1265738 RepID=M5RTV9_9BACT|nr:hypothetical protein [Rhodopirellula maiorica]EMI17399.1 putative membrane protein [Rhodopirellula maiorica SM1]